MKTTVYVVRDAADEYLADPKDNSRTPAAEKAWEFETLEQAQQACCRITDCVIKVEHHTGGGFVETREYYDTQ